MHPIDLISPCLSEDDAPLPDGTTTTEAVCAVTGARTRCVPRKMLLKKGFTNEAILKAPLSDWVSIEAFRVLRYRPERSRSWICDGQTFRALARTDVRDIVIGEKYPPVWTGYVTTSFKKHGSLWARVNVGKKRFWRFESLDVDCSDHPRLLGVWARLNCGLRNGIGRPAMESLACPPYIMAKIGTSRWLDFELWARPFMASPLYRFLLYLLPSKKELDDEKGLPTRVENPLNDIDFFEAADDI